MLSAVALAYADASVSASTLKAYAAAVANFKAYYRENDWLPEASLVTPEAAANYLAHLAKDTTLASGTISGYSSALRNWVSRERRWTDEPNPFDSLLVCRTLEGIKRERTPAEAAARAQRPVTAMMGPEALAQLRPYLDPEVSTTPSKHSTAWRLMIWAAACLGSHCLLRPNEFVKDPPLDAWRVTFRSAKGATIAPIKGGPTQLAHSAYIHLGVTKADQNATNKAVHTSSPLAVDALWRWATHRVDTGLSEREAVFFHDGKHRLSLRVLLEALRDAHVAAGKGPVLLTGRCFRRGGADELVRAGVSAEVVQEHGRWKSRAMVYRYAGQDALAARKQAADVGKATRL